MALLLNPRVLLVLAVIALGLGLYLKGNADGKRTIRAEWTTSIAQANAEARSLEQARQRRADEAAGLAAAAANRDRVALAHVRAERDGMRGTLDAIERASRESHDAATKHVAAIRAVFDDCSAEVLRLAEEATGHARDSLTYQQAWPK
jgi:hypothetical protein